MTSLTVLFVSDSAVVMGAEHSMFNIARHLPDFDTVPVLAARGGGELEKRWRDADFGFVGLNAPPRTGVRPQSGKGFNGFRDLLRLPATTVRGVALLRRMVRDTDAAVVHSNSLLTHLECVAAGRLSRVPVVLELHEIVAPGPGRILLGLATLLADRTIALSSAVVEQLPRWARKNVTIVGQGIDADRFVPAPARPDVRAELTSDVTAPLVAAVGRIDPEKGLATLVDAVALVRAAGTPCHLALVGKPGKDDGSHLRALRERAAVALPGAFRVLDHAGAVEELLPSVDLLACPSDAEPFGLVVLEAQACGIPVVVTAAGGPLDYTTDRKTVLQVPPRDAHRLADAIAELLGDAPLRRSLTRAARERVLQRHRADRRAATIAAEYRKLVSR